MKQLALLCLVLFLTACQSDLEKKIDSANEEYKNFPSVNVNGYIDTEKLDAFSDDVKNGDPSDLHYFSLVTRDRKQIFIYGLKMITYS